VALHGNNGTMYEFVMTRLGEFASVYGYLVACPAWEAGGAYQEQGEQEVFDVIEDVSNKYQVDEERTYLLGVSRGGWSAISIGLRNPHRFAGLASVSGIVRYGELLAVTENNEKLPVFVAHGRLDKTVPIEDSIRLIERLKVRGYNYGYSFVEDLGHDLRVLDISLPEIFESFNHWRGGNRSLREPEAHLHERCNEESTV